MTIAERELEQPLEHEIDPDVQEELAKHPGKWAALTRSKILAIKDTSTEAFAAAREQGVDSPILYLIPDSRSGYSYF